MTGRPKVHGNWRSVDEMLVTRAESITCLAASCLHDALIGRFRGCFVMGAVRTRRIGILLLCEKEAHTWTIRVPPPHQRDFVAHLGNIANMC